jgi:hypothetical protein
MIVLVPTCRISYFSTAYSTGAGKKNAVVVIAMAFRPQMLMPAILRSDLEAVREVLRQLDSLTG